ncbi:helix-turn-helix protein [Streptomyces sp. Amel2xB2]|uniref:helix-turn-helix domain-containing protein n=1 Tax=Streptomyces sp. Amel2xB2 TaxID=1305829 RepID=UPI000DBFB946|nr:helix-turn-helix transcriptional regulator [Streptomyces sp. Amel2xB2]RAJ71806.1 helix-turn-helix protein [Streptomyces sp. Amel2xB2]
MTNGRVNGTGSPPPAWEYCGNQIKLWRERAGVSREDLARRASYSYEAVRSMERGVRKPQLAVLQVADVVCGANGILLAAAPYLKPERFPSYSQDYMEAESSAVAISWYENEYIPGLLQTEETVRALLTSYAPPLDDETIEERARARLQRHVLLEKQTTAFSFVLSETALRDRVVDEAAHAEQLRHLLKIAERRNVTVQVMAIGSGAHPGRRGPFVILESQEHEYLGYEEGQTTGILYADPEKVSVLRQRHDMILRQALSPGESVRFIEKLAEEL